MLVRAWVLTGSGPRVVGAGTWMMVPPAEEWEPGDVIWWRSSPGTEVAHRLVCVELPEPAGVEHVPEASLGEVRELQARVDEAIEKRRAAEQTAAEEWEFRSAFKRLALIATGRLPWSAEREHHVVRDALVRVGLPACWVDEEIDKETQRQELVYEEPRLRAGVSLLWNIATDKRTFAHLMPMERVYVREAAEWVGIDADKIDHATRKDT